MVIKSFEACKYENYLFLQCSVYLILNLKANLVFKTFDSIHMHRLLCFIYCSSNSEISYFFILTFVCDLIILYQSPFIILFPLSFSLFPSPSLLSHFPLFLFLLFISLVGLFLLSLSLSRFSFYLSV
jgi:hypothetical protein